MRQSVKGLTEMNVNLSNELNFSESLATLHATQYSLQFNKY